MTNDKKGLWLYSVIENKGPLNIEAQGIHGDTSVFTISYDDFSVVVSEEPLKKYPLMRDFLLAHQLVNEKVMRFGPMLPVKFCTMAENTEQIVEQVLKQESKTEEFRKTFDEIRGKNEYGLRARWKNLDQIFTDLEQENEKLKLAKEKVMKLSAQERHMALIDIGHLVKGALEEKNSSTGQVLINELIPLSDQYKKNNVIGDANIVNVSFLIDEKFQIPFDQAINNLVEKYDPQIHFKYIGPIPPFNFVEIAIRWDNFKRGNQ